MSSTNLIRKGISGWVFTVPTVGYWIPAKFQQISLSIGSSNAKDSSKVTSTTSVVQVSRHTGWRIEYDSLISICANL